MAVSLRWWEWWQVDVDRHATPDGAELFTQ